ncbi:reduced growth phenotype protein 1 [Tanacetum coccineum]
MKWMRRLVDAVGIVPATTIFLDVYWKDMDAESEWARANETFDGVEEDYENSRDDVSSVSSYNPARGSLHKAFDSSLSLQSSAARSSKDVPYNDQRSTMSSYMALPRLSAAEVLYGSTEESVIGNGMHFVLDIIKRTIQQQQYPIPLEQGIEEITCHLEDLQCPQLLSMDDDSRASAVPRTVEPVASVTDIRCSRRFHSRKISYNIRLDDQVLLRFSPPKPESTYYFGDMIGGTLTFFHAEGTRRCLELSVTLELSETISRRSAHPSRRHSPTITKMIARGGNEPSRARACQSSSSARLYFRKLELELGSFRALRVELELGLELIQSDHHEVVADLVQTSFLFSVPMDGPMSFSTRHVSVQWVLRFEFFTTPKNVDWTRYEHPLLIEGRDKCEWVLPITVNAPPFTTTVSHSRSEKPASLEPLWDRS